jgi:hypothetical protein
MYVCIMTQNGPVTAPGSQGVFRGKGVGSKWAPGNFFFGAGVVLSSCRDKCSILIRRRIQKQMSFEL